MDLPLNSDSTHLFTNKCNHTCNIYKLLLQSNPILHYGVDALLLKKGGKNNVTIQEMGRIHYRGIGLLCRTSNSPAFNRFRPNVTDGRDDAARRHF
ncbi:MAG TPA: hypothetical protein PLC74_10775, partial [Acetobacteraceae bacterium]|nr:hypothetical protein [Acetobacteraceae bacterium]